MAFEEPDVLIMFPVPLVTMKVKNPEKLNQGLIDEIAERRKVEPGIERSNRYGWHSEPDLFHRAEAAHKKLALEIDAIVAAASAKLIPEMPEDLVIRHEGWINASPRHAMNAPHDHPGVFWSGCYYISVPVPDDADDKMSGAIEFIDPRGAIGMTANIETPFTRERYTVRPQAGICLLWPGFVKHWVHPNRANEERVSAAFNSWFVRKR